MRHGLSCLEPEWHWASSEPAGGSPRRSLQGKSRASSSVGPTARRPQSSREGDRERAAGG